MAQQTCVPAREECNNYHDVFPVSDWSRWFAISSLLASFSLNFSFMGGFRVLRQKSKTPYSVKSFAMLLDASMLQFLMLQFH
jgi:hypothetical protein